MADEYHKKSGHMFVDKTKELRSGEEKTYIEYIQKLLNILINEIHLNGDEVLTVAALYGSLEYTDLTADVIEKEFDTDILYMVDVLKERDGETVSGRIEEQGAGRQKRKAGDFMSFAEKNDTLDNLLLTFTACKYGLFCGMQSEMEKEIGAAMEKGS